MRYTIQLLQQDEKFISSFGKALLDIPHKVKQCNVCHTITDQETCDICQNEQRNSACVCVVQDLRDIIAIENTHQFNGKYHVLGGVISPMDGIGPKDLNINSLVERIQQNREIEEVILALPSTMEGDTTSFFLYKKLKDFSLKISTIARGISFGDQIEYADELTLGKSIQNRILYDSAN